MANDLTLRAFYTLSRTIDPTTGGNGGAILRTYRTPMPAGCMTSARAVTIVRTTPRSTSSTTSRSSATRRIGLLRDALGGWELSGIVTITSGLPINPQLTGGQSGNGLPNATNRPDQVGVRLSYPHTVGEWFSTRPSRCPQLARGAMPDTTPCVARAATTGTSRSSRASCSARLAAAASSCASRSFNTWNHTEFNQVSNGLGSSNFGQVTSAFDPRIFQLGGKIYF